ncbi:hypothetical protein NMG60_11003690 [Bertholletia excelsa]
MGFQAWWDDTGENSISSDIVGETRLDLSVQKHSSGALVIKSNKSQANIGQDGEDDADKELPTTVLQQSDGNSKQAQKDPSSTNTLTMERCFTQPQIELIGHSVACTSYPYADPYHGSVMPTYGPQGLVYSNMLGMHQARMALPLEVTEEPVYVNAKQYHGILRRRQSRAKAELAKKLIKVRKQPYLHESRHLHAMRRARGCGGRFLSNKKIDNAALNGTSDKCSGSETRVSANLSNSLSSQSSTIHKEIMETAVHNMGEQSVWNMQSVQTPSNCNVNMNHPRQLGFHMSAFYSFPHERVDEGDCSGRQTLTIK